MAPPHSKRTLFSLNVDSDISHVRQKANSHSTDNKHNGGKVQVVESNGPETRHADLKFVGKPVEELVDRTVDGVVAGSGKNVQSVEGEVAYHTENAGPGTAAGSYTPGSRYRSGRSQRSIEAQYDTSEL